jgi:polyvinyl alcohol dehydrogenase (cytochrome)
MRVSGLSPRWLVLAIWLPAFQCLLGYAGSQVGHEGPTAPDATGFGKALFADHCSQCHEHGVGGAPPLSLLKKMSPTALYNVLTKGAMVVQASPLSDQERRGIVRYLTGREPDALPRPLRMCSNGGTWLDRDAEPVATGWGMDVNNTRSVSAERSGLAARDLHRLKLRWAFVFPDSVAARSQPTIAGGGLFVGSQSGAVYAMDAASGCVHWVFQASGEVHGTVVFARTAAKTTGDAPGDPPGAVLYFGDGFANVYALDALTGTRLWQRKIDEHPTARIAGTPIIVGDRLYVPVGSWGEEIAAAAPDFVCCTFRGSLVALDRATGAVIWKRYTIPEAAVEQGKSPAGHPQFGPSGASIWSSPTFDQRRDLLYVGTGDNFSDPADDNSDAVFAVSAATGVVRWKTQVTPGDTYNDSCMRGLRGPNCPKNPGADIDFTAPPVLFHGKGGKDVLLAAQKSGDTYGLDPDTGSVLWHTRLSRDPNLWSGGIWYGMALQNGRLITPAVSYTVINAPAAASTAFDDLFLSSPVNGLNALDPLSGRLLWATPAGEHCKKAVCASVMMAPLGIPGAVLAGSLDGYIHAVDDRSGKALWSFNTAEKFKSLNGELGRGGVIMGAGAVMVANGMMYVTSSNLKSSAVLIAFSKAR